jgi:uncharacterized protein with LGFP repeats
VYVFRGRTKVCPTGLKRIVMTRASLRKVITVGVATVMVAVGLVAIAPAQEAAALSGGSFDAGYIISDSLFYDSAAMTQPQIQQFLDQNIGSCLNGRCLNVLRATTFDRPKDRTVCGAYTGAANEPVAQIIYKVQSACGISAKVLLVTLQKEQSLVAGSIAREPSDSRVGRAMGYACPDTTAGVCDARYFGIYNQLYMAAWQLKRYSTPDLFGNYHPGSRLIGFNPNSDCGAKWVNIRNHATAALYNYTPYTPNDAALANLYGTAHCGAYGNRNFWVFYNNWFGDPTGSSAAFDMDALYQLNGGAAGAFGTLQTESACSAASGACWRNYQFAVIHWSKASGAGSVTGPMLAAYRTAGGTTGPLGLPSGPLVTFPSDGGKSALSFGGTSTIYVATAGSFVVRGVIRTTYFTAGGEGGSLGWPIGAEACGVGGCNQLFEGGSVYASAAGAHVVPSAIDVAYRAAGGSTSTLGPPTTAVFLFPSQPERVAQSFAGGATVYASSAGSFVIRGVARNTFFIAGGESGALGWPIATEVCDGVTGQCSQAYERGTIYFDSRVGVAASEGIDAAYLAAGGPWGSLGKPTSVLFTYPSLPGRVAQTFTGGTIYGSDAGSFLIRGPARNAFFAAGGEGGALGWPIGAEVCDAATSRCTQKLELGTIYSSPAGGAAIRDDIAISYIAAGGPWGPLGKPSSGVFMYPSLPGRVAQSFTGGATIYASPAGSFVVKGANRTAFFASGGEWGPMGWPIAAEECDAGTSQCTQAFEKGTVYSSPAGNAAVLEAISVAYRPAGGPWGFLGQPSSGVFTYPALPGRLAQSFAGGGTVYASPAGSFVVGGSMRTSFFASGGEGGPLGWPIAAEVCDAGTSQCTQQFERGTVLTP